MWLLRCVMLTADSCFPDMSFAARKTKWFAQLNCSGFSFIVGENWWDHLHHYFLIIYVMLLPGMIHAVHSRGISLPDCIAQYELHVWHSIVSTDTEDHSCKPPLLSQRTLFCSSTCAFFLLLLCQYYVIALRNGLFICCTVSGKSISE